MSQPALMRTSKSFLLGLLSVSLTKEKSCCFEAPQSQTIFSKLHGDLLQWARNDLGSPTQHLLAGETEEPKPCEGISGKLRAGAVMLMVYRDRDEEGTTWDMWLSTLRGEYSDCGVQTDMSRCEDTVQCASLL